jgi:predicted hydrocarbon binding protein
MEKEEIFFKELVTKNLITVVNNRLNLLNEIDLTTYGARAWAYTLQEIGKKKDEKFLFDLGYLMGGDVAEELLAVLKKKREFITKKLYDLTNIIQLTGFGIVTIKKENNKTKITVENNYTIIYAKELYGKDSKVCSFYAGVYSAFFNKFEGKNIKLKQQNCICKGDSKCIFIS